jgi:hypothetical protein
LDYVRALWESQVTSGTPERAQCERMKKFMNYIGYGLDEQFLHHIRRSATQDDFFRICGEFLDHDRPMKLEPSKVAS